MSHDSGWYLEGKKLGQSITPRGAVCSCQCREVCTLLPLCCEQGAWLDGLGMIHFLRLGMEKKQDYCSPVPLEVKYEEGAMKESL